MILSPPRLRRRPAPQRALSLICGLSSLFMSPLGLFPQPVQMTSPFAAIDAIFSRRRDGAAILFLIEDSSHMVPLWQHLRDFYIPSFLAAIKRANPSAPVSPFTPSHLLTDIL